MPGALGELLSEEQMRLLRVIYEPFGASGEYPLWQYADLTLDREFGLDAASVLDSLPVVGHRGPGTMSYGLTWRSDSHMQPQPGTHIALTVAGLRRLPEAEPLLASFLEAIRFLVDEQRNLVPDPRRVVEATVRSEAIEKQILTPSGGSADAPLQAAMREIRAMFGYEPYLYGAVQQPQQGVEQWTVRVPAVLREYRDVATIGDYVSCVTRLVAPAPEPSVPPSSGPLDVPYAVGFLDAVWISRTRSHLFVNLDPASVARLTLACGDEGDFNSLMSALADVLGQVVVPGTARPPQRGALEAVRDYLVPLLDAEAADRVSAAFDTLIRLRHIRVSSQHADARHKAVAAFAGIGLSFPPRGWGYAWDHVAGMARGALDVVREEVHAGLPQS